MPPYLLSPRAASPEPQAPGLCPGSPPVRWSRSDHCPAEPQLCRRPLPGQPPRVSTAMPPCHGWWARPPSQLSCCCPEVERNPWDGDSRGLAVVPHLSYSFLPFLFLPSSVLFFWGWSREGLHLGLQPIRSGRTPTRAPFLTPQLGTQGEQFSCRCCSWHVSGHVPVWPSRSRVGDSWIFPV